MPQLWPEFKWSDGTAWRRASDVLKRWVGTPNISFREDILFTPRLIVKRGKNMPYVLTGRGYLKGAGSNEIRPSVKINLFLWKLENATPQSLVLKKSMLRWIFQRLLFLKGGTFESHENMTIDKFCWKK